MTLRSRLVPCLQGAALLLALAAGVPALAAQDEKVASASAREQQQFMDMLEFLGEFTTEDGRWVDPEELERQVETTRSDDRNGDRNDGRSEDRTDKGAARGNLIMKYLTLEFLAAQPGRSR